MQHLKTAALLIATVLILGSAPMARSGEIRISAAASMTTVVRDLAENFLASHPEVTIITNFGPSGGLAKQIQQGAPADLYISANTKWMNYLADLQLIEPGTETVFAYNSLVFVGHSSTSASSLADLPKLTRIGIGTPQSVPAGQYAAQALEAAGLYDQLLQSGKLVMAKDVRQALIYADRGETDGSFVYKTDALLATTATILFTVPQNLYDRVAYPIALTASGGANSDAKKLYAYILSQEAKARMVTHGFSSTAN